MNSCHGSFSDKGSQMRILIKRYIKRAVRLRSCVQNAKFLRNRLLMGGAPIATVTQKCDFFINLTVILRSYQFHLAEIGVQERLRQNYFPETLERFYP